LNQRYFVGFLVAGALGLATLVVVRPGSRVGKTPPVAPLAVIPAGPAFVFDVDLARLRKSADGAELSKLGVDRLAPASSGVAFQPLRDVDEVVIAVAGGAHLEREGPAVFDRDAVAVVAAGRFTGKAAADTAVERIRARGGEPVRTRLGSFESVRDLKATGEVATRDGLVVLSDGAYLRAVLAAAEGQRADGSETERTRDRVHAELRRTFGRGAPVTATLALPEGWLEAALGDADVRRSPLALVRSAALRLNIGDAIDLDALFVCKTKDDCAEVAKFLKGARSDLERVLGSSSAIRRFAAVGDEDDERVEISMSLSTSDVVRFLAPHDAGN